MQSGFLICYISAQTTPKPTFRSNEILSRNSQLKEANQKLVLYIFKPLDKDI